MTLLAALLLTLPGLWVLLGIALGAAMTNKQIQTEIGRRRASVALLRADIIKREHQ